MVEYVKGDIVEAFKNNDIDVLIHGCNCHKRMGGGIARQIRDTFPEAYDADINGKCDPKYIEVFMEADKDPSKKLGYYTMASFLRYNNFTHEQQFKFILNAYTQFNLGNQATNDKDLCNLYKSIMFCFRRINEDFKDYYALDIAMPKIGCGIAGGDWKVVEALINKEFKNRLIYVYERD